MTEGNEHGTQHVSDFDSPELVEGRILTLSDDHKNSLQIPTSNLMHLRENIDAFSF